MIFFSVYKKKKKRGFCHGMFFQMFRSLLLKVISSHLLGLTLKLPCLKVSVLAPKMLSKCNVCPLNSPVWLMLLNFLSGGAASYWKSFRDHCCNIWE